MSLTCEQVTVQALARASEVSNTIPATRSLCYRRIGVRQQLLLEGAAKANPEFYGASATAPLTAGVADLADIVDPVPVPAMIQTVQVANPGTSGLLAGATVNIVPADDIESAIRPRATFRDRVLRGVGVELALVTSVAIYYARRAPVYGATDKDTVVELASPYDELLVIDLARWLLAKSPGAAKPEAVAAVTAMSAEEAALATAFSDYVRDYAPMQARFGTGL